MNNKCGCQVSTDPRDRTIAQLRAELMKTQKDLSLAELQIADQVDARRQAEKALADLRLDLARSDDVREVCRAALEPLAIAATRIPAWLEDDCSLGSDVKYGPAKAVVHRGLEVRHLRAAGAAYVAAGGTLPGADVTVTDGVLPRTSPESHAIAAALVQAFRSIIGC